MQECRNAGMQDDIALRLDFLKCLFQKKLQSGFYLFHQ